jgi:pyrroloquinoline quinone biosynthesis protein E
MLTGDARNADPVCDLSPHHHVITEAIAKAHQAQAKPSTTRPILFRDDKNSRALSESAAVRP